jgi:hypothetical protein
MKSGDTQQRGRITDTFHGSDPATCECAHGKVWVEGDRFEPEGRACPECVREWIESAERKERFGG